MTQRSGSSDNEARDTAEAGNVGSAPAIRLLKGLKRVLFPQFGSSPLNAAMSIKDGTPACLTW